MRVFLGGTVNGSRWRDYVMPRLEVEYFDPVVKDWNEEAQQREIHERQTCDFVLYVLTPCMEGFYSIAEVTDDSFKRPDRTIFCYLPEDGDLAFSELQLKQLEKLSNKVTENGALVLPNLDAVIDYMNSANQREKSIQRHRDQMYDVFISYGRRHSLEFARRLNNDLVAAGKKVWFDMNNIPLAVDFQIQIDEGIEKSDNVVVIISPHSVKSEYCLKEIMLAISYKKRIIPILHIEPTDSWHKLHPELAKLNWIYFRQKEDFNIPLDQWKWIDSYDNSYKGLLKVLNSHNDYLRMHTLLLHNALLWIRQIRNVNYLLVGKDRQDAEKWLLTKEFTDEVTKQKVQPPALPGKLHAEYIVESKKNANNLHTEVFISYVPEDSDLLERIKLQLAYYNFTSWTHGGDIESGAEFISSIKRGIEQADNFLYVVTRQAVGAGYSNLEIDYAVSLNKRIIPILLENVPGTELPPAVRSLSAISFWKDTLVSEAEELVLKNLSDKEKLADISAKSRAKTEFDLSFDELLQVLYRDAEYFQKHKVFLVQALKWIEQNRNNSILLRGFNLENAKEWLKTSAMMQWRPLEIQEKYIRESEAKVGLLETDVFISYSRKDSDLSRKINDNLQITGKNTWFDQESIASASDFQKEIYKGIESADNFVFILSPDSVKSPYCEDEVNFAESKNKRIITVLSREFNLLDLPDGLRKIQWIDFNKRDFKSAFGELIRTLDTDREYVRLHTRYAQLASEWESKSFATDLLLRGNEFVLAEKWLQQALGMDEHGNKIKPKNPTATQIQIMFVEASRDALVEEKRKEKQQQEAMLRLEQEKSREAQQRAEEQQRAAKWQKKMSIILSVALIGAITLGVFAYYKSQEAIFREKQAKFAYEELEKQREILMQNKLELEKALAYIDSLQQEKENALKNATSLDETRKIIEKFDQQIQNQTIISVTENKTPKQHGGSRPIISNQLKAAIVSVKETNPRKLLDSINEYERMFNTNFIAEDKQEILIRQIANYTQLLTIQPKNAYKASMANAYDRLIENETDTYNKIRLVQAAIELRTEVKDAVPNNTDIINKLAMNYGNLSWYSLVTKNYKSAISAAQTGVALDPSQTWIYINMAHAYLFMGNFESATKLYLKYRNVTFTDGAKFKDKYLRDFRYFRENGMLSKDFKRVEAMLDF